MVAMYWPLAPRAAMLAWCGAAGACCWRCAWRTTCASGASRDADDATLLRWRAQLEGAGAGTGVDVGPGGVAVLGPGHALPPDGADAGRLQPAAWLRCNCWPRSSALFIAFICLVLVPTIVRIATDTQPALALAAGRHPERCCSSSLLIMGACATQRARPGDPAEVAHRQAGRAAARGDGRVRDGAPRRRGRQPRQDAVLRRRQPRPAPAAARDGPVRRGAAPAQPRPGGGLAGEQHQRVGGRAGRPVRRAARHHAHRHRRRRRQPGAGARCASCSRGCACTSSRPRSRRAWPCASTASSTWPSPTRCCSSASCATWSATPSATPTTAACSSAAGSAAASC